MPRGAAVAGLVVGLSIGRLAPAAAAPDGTGQVVRVEHYGASTLPARGPISAPVTIELFFAPSVNLSSRANAFRLLDELQRRHPTRVRIVYRVIKRNAQPPGPLVPTLALEAHAQGKFFEFVAAVQSQRQLPGRDQLIEIGKHLGLDPQRLERALVDDRYGDAIEANERRLERLRGTTGPSVFFNDQPLKSLFSMREADFEKAYRDAYERASVLLDRGVEPSALGEAFDAELLQRDGPLLVSSRAIDDDDPAPATKGQPLATPPLVLTGLPSLGEAGGSLAIPVVVLCRPNDNTSCPNTMRVARNVERVYRGEVKIVWAPWFDVTRDDAADLTLLADAALCAETIGSNPDDLAASAGWQWVTELHAQLTRAHGRRIPPDQLIDALAHKLGVDETLLSACRARLATTSLAWITAARHAGVRRSPAIVIGGRIYEGLQDEPTIRALVEAELAPGVLGEVAPAWHAPPK